MDKEEKNVEMVHLSPYMKSVIERLTADKKRPAVHTYNATLNSFTKFFGGQGTEEMLVTDVFTAGKLKEYEAWLRSRNASWNTVSTYMRVLKAVYNRLVEAKRLTYDARLFDSVYTKVEAQSKRSLTEEQMNTLLHTDFEKLPEDVQVSFPWNAIHRYGLPAQTRPKGTLYHLLPSQNRKENGSTHSA